VNQKPDEKQAKPGKQATAGDIDPVTFSIVRHRMFMLVDEMATTLMKTSTSPVLSESMDFNTGLYTPDGDVIATGPFAMIMTMPMRFGIKYITEKFSEDPGIADGDQFIFNDPYLGMCTHQGDTSIVKPIYYDGELIAWSGACCHELDIGATLTPGVPITEVYQEGLRMSPIKLVEKGRVRIDVFNALINMVRMPVVGLDYRAQIASNNVASERFQELVDEYDLDTVKATIKQLIIYSREMTQERLTMLPDGVASHLQFMDHDGQENRIYEVRCKMTNRGGRLKLDFTGSSPQAPGMLNSGYGGTWGGVLEGILLWLAGDIPWNQGIFNCMELVLPEGIIINALPPSPMGGGSIGGCNAAAKCTAMCLARFMSASDEYRDWAMAGWLTVNGMAISGTANQFGTPFTYTVLDHDAGGCGATCDADGDDVVGVSKPTQQIPNVESHEEFHPILFLFRRIAPDTGGPGKYRGGMALEEAIIHHGIPEDQGIVFQLKGSGAEQPNSPGLSGAYPGCINLYRVVRDSDTRAQLERGFVPTHLEEFNGTVERLPPKCLDLLRRNDTMYYYVSGGGGWGDPLDREPEDVARDFRNGLVSEGHAREAYGVVVVAEAGKVDHDGTEKLRERMREERLRWA